MHVSFYFAAVSCPVCGIQLPQLRINSHLDLCLTGSLPAAPTITTTPTHPSPSQFPPSAGEGTTLLAHQGVHYQRERTLPRLPKFVFSIMTDKQLRKKLKDYHLLPQGTRNSMIARLKEFTLLYKAERDSLNPRTCMQISTAYK